MVVKDKYVSKYILKHLKTGTAVIPVKKKIFLQSRYDTGQLCAE